MPLQDLLVCIDRTAAGDARLKLAFNLARANGAYLTGAYALPEVPAAPAASMGFGVAPPAGMTGLADDGLSTGGADP